MKLFGPLIIAVSVFLTSCNQSELVSPKTATVINPPIALTDFSLIQHNGTPFTKASLQDNKTLMFFGFTFCPDVCPTTMQMLVLSLEKIEKSGIENAQVVFVSVDPKRDTPERLKEYLAHFDDSFIGVTGELADIESFTRSIGIVFSHQAPDESGYYAVDHPAVILMINDEAKMSGISSAPHDWQDIANDFIAIHN